MRTLDGNGGNYQRNSPRARFSARCHPIPCNVITFSDITVDGQERKNMRFWAIAGLGAAAGVVLVAVGFNLRPGGYGSNWWLIAPAAYIPAAFLGAVVAVGVYLIIGK